MNAPFAASLGAALVLAATLAPPAQARHASKECQGGLPVLTLLEGGGYAVNAYYLDCGRGTARSALVIPDGAAATGDGVACSLDSQPFDLTGNAVAANAIRAGAGDTVLCKDGQSVEQAKSRHRKPRPRYVKLRPSDGAPLPGGTACETSNEILSGSFLLDGQEADVTVEAILVDCAASGSALVVPRGATTTVAPIIKGVRLSCPVDRFSIANRPEGRSSKQVVVADDQIAGCKARVYGRNRQTASFDLTLDGAPPTTCEGSCTVFATSTTYDGNLGGLASADAECNALADGAGLSGTYKAWLSDESASPSTRFTQATVPYVLVDGTRIADNWADLTDGAIDGFIDQTESGSVPAVSIWTGTRANGTEYSGINCNNWTEGTGSAAGIIGATALNGGYFWTGAQASGTGRVTVGCQVSLSFYCFQQ